MPAFNSSAIGKVFNLNSHQKTFKYRQKNKTSKDILLHFSECKSIMAYF